MNIKPKMEKKIKKFKIFIFLLKNKIQEKFQLKKLWLSKIAE